MYQKQLYFGKGKSCKSVDNTIENGFLSRNKKQHSCSTWYKLFLLDGCIDSLDGRIASAMGNEIDLDFTVCQNKFFGTKNETFYSVNKYESLSQN